MRDVMRGASAVDRYVGLPEQEAFDIEYWLLEEAKLQRMPAPKAQVGRIALVTGGAGGIVGEIVDPRVDAARPIRFVLAVEGHRQVRGDAGTDVGVLHVHRVGGGERETRQCDQAND